MNARKIELFEIIYPLYGIKLRGKINWMKIGAMVSENLEEKRIKMRKRFGEKNIMRPQINIY